MLGASVLVTLLLLEAGIRVWDWRQAAQASQARAAVEQQSAARPQSPVAAQPPGPAARSHENPPEKPDPLPTARAQRPPARNEPFTDWGWIVSDPELGYRLHPNERRFSARGSQAEVAGLPPSGARLLILGDSVAYHGADFRDTLPGRLEEALNKDPGVDRVEVLNSSIVGYTNYQELHWLKKYGLEWQPEIVGVIFVMNDLFRFLHTVNAPGTDSHASRRDARPGVPGHFPPAAPGVAYAAQPPAPPGASAPSADDAHLEFTPEAHAGMKSWLLWAGRHSRLLQVLYRNLTIIQATMNWYASLGYSFDYRAEFHNAWLDKPWTMIEQQMAEMKQVARRHNLRLFLVAVPFGDQYKPEYLARDREYVLKPQRRLTAICRSLDIPCLDLYGHLTAEEHFVDDRIHLSRRGRAAAARLIADFLKVNGLLPRRRAGASRPGARNASPTPGAW